MGGHPFTLARPQLSWSDQLGPPTKGPPEQKAQQPLAGRTIPAGLAVQVEHGRGRADGEGGAGQVPLVQGLVLKIGK